MSSSQRSTELPAAWREPTSLLPLHWGTYRGRYLAGLTLIIGGGIHVLGSNVWTLPFLLIGTVAHAAGWAILPARGWRRIVAVGPSIATIWILLAGPQALWVITLSFACWLLVRHRPRRAYLTVVLPLAAGIIMAQFLKELSGMPLALAIAMTVVVASAWAARLIAGSERIPGQSSGDVR